VLLAAAAADRTVRIWALDPKEVELHHWRPIAEPFVGADIAEATDVLRTSLILRPTPARGER
jgi:hypothetical protein